jgi:hypothetical protein
MAKSGEKGGPSSLGFACNAPFRKHLKSQSWRVRRD